MAKNTCSYPGCTSRSEGERCFRHKKKKPLKPGTGLRAKKKTKEEIQQQIDETEKMWNLFLEIWNERGPYSEVSDQWLGLEPLTVFFDHLLPKETFPEVKYEKWNIILCTWDEHTQKGNGFPKRTHQEAINRAKEIYNTLFNS